MLLKIHKSHSKADLVKLINDINIPIIFSHSSNKTDIQKKLIEWVENNKIVSFEENLYKIVSIDDLIIFLNKKSPKKSLSVKEKNNVMTICKKIIQYCRDCKYNIEKSLYDDEKEIKDDMLYISQYGDLPSVRRCCRMMNANIKSKDVYTPIISPQVQEQIDEKKIIKQVIMPDKLIIKKGLFKVTFD